MLKKSLLIMAAFCSASVAVLHIFIISQGAWAYRFFGAGETIASMAEQGSWIPGLLTSAIVAAFCLAAAYFISAAGLIPRLPFLRVGVLTIATVYTLRGLAILPAPFFHVEISQFDLWSSLISLAVGLLHVAGVCLFWWGERE